MKIEINVSKNKRHYFATSERSLTNKQEFVEVFNEIRKAFPNKEGYEIFVNSKAEEHGISFHDKSGALSAEDIYDRVDPFRLKEQKDSYSRLLQRYFDFQEEKNQLEYLDYSKSDFETRQDMIDRIHQVCDELRQLREKITNSKVIL